MTKEHDIPKRRPSHRRCESRLITPWAMEGAKVPLACEEFSPFWTEGIFDLGPTILCPQHMAAAVWEYGPLTFDVVLHAHSDDAVKYYRETGDPIVGGYPLIRDGERTENE